MATEDQTGKSFNRRAFISISMLLSGIGLPVSGLMNHFLAFDPMSAERHAWMSAHNILGILFVIFAVLHITMNWKAIARYSKNISGYLVSKEALYALLLVFSCVFLLVMHAFH